MFLNISNDVAFVPNAKTTSFKRTRKESETVGKNKERIPVLPLGRYMCPPLHQSPHFLPRMDHLQVDSAAVAVDEDDVDVATTDSARRDGDKSAGGSSGRVKGPWSPEEDAILSQFVSKFGARNWSLIARGISGRSGKSCRLRWCNQLDPCVKRKPFTGNLHFHSNSVVQFLVGISMRVSHDVNF